MNQAVLPTNNTDVAPKFEGLEIQSIMKALGDDLLCSNCSRPMTGAELWCHSCGYHQSLGTFVETQVEEAHSAANEAARIRDWIRCGAGASLMILLVVGGSIASRYLTASYLDSATSWRLIVVTHWRQVV